MDQANTAALKAEELSKAGGIPTDGMSPTGAPESTIGMSRNEKFFSQGRALDQSQREGYKTFGDKATGEGINAARKIMGRAPIANTPQEFDRNINTSVGYGGKSALLDQAGRDKAMKAGIGAGLSYEESDAAVSKAYDFLKGKYGDPTTPTPTTPKPKPKPDEDTTTPSTVSPTPTVPPEVPVEKGPIGQFFDNVLAGGSPERALIKGGSAMYNARRAAAKAAAEAAAKIAGAAGDATKPFNMVDDAAKAAAKAASEGLKQRGYDFTKPAGDATKPFNMVDDAAKFADTARTLNATLDAAAVAAQKTGLDAYNAALQAGQTKEAAVAAGNAAESAALKSAYKDAADSVGKPFDAVDEAAGAADEAAKVAEKAGYDAYNAALQAGQSEKAALDAYIAAEDTRLEAAGAADKTAGAADKTAGAADKTAGAADEAAKVAEKGKDLFSPLIKAVANSGTGRLLAKTARVATPALRLGARAAGPVLDVIDVAQFFGGNPITGKSKEEVKADFQSDYETLGQRFFAPKSLGEFGGAIGDAASIPKTALGATESVSQLLKSQRGARESEAALANMENIYKAIDDRRREMYPDEVFAKLPRNPKERAAAGLSEDTPTQSEVKNMIRNEFRKAGAKF